MPTGHDIATALSAFSRRHALSLCILATFSYGRAVVVATTTFPTATKGPAIILSCGHDATGTTTTVPTATKGPATIPPPLSHAATIPLLPPPPSPLSPETHQLSPLPPSPTVPAATRGLATIPPFTVPCNHNAAATRGPATIPLPPSPVAMMSPPPPPPSPLPPKAPPPFLLQPFPAARCRRHHHYRPRCHQWSCHHCPHHPSLCPQRWWCWWQRLGRGSGDAQVEGTAPRKGGEGNGDVVAGGDLEDMWPEED